MSRSPNSAYYAKLQEDGFRMALLIDLETQGPHLHWTSANAEMTYTLSGADTLYEPFPGQTGEGVRQSNDMQVSVIDFIVANTGTLLQDLLGTYDLDFATVKIGRVFVDTPNLGRMDIFEGKIGDYTYNRAAISGQVRNKWNSANVKWPYYNYQDKCNWTFGGSGCGVDTTSLTLAFSAGNIVAASTDYLNVTLVSTTLAQSFANGRFDFGRLTVTDGPNSGYARTIRSHTGDLIQLSHRLPVNSFATFGFEIFPGCRKRRIADCRSLYNNDENFLGFPWIPIQEDGF